MCQYLYNFRQSNIFIGVVKIFERPYQNSLVPPIKFFDPIILINNTNK